MVPVLHKLFIQELLKQSPGMEIAPSNQNTVPTPESINELSKYPNNDIEHRHFFHEEKNLQKRSVRVTQTVFIDTP